MESVHDLIKTEDCVYQIFTLEADDILTIDQVTKLISTAHDNGTLKKLKLAINPF